MERLFRYVSFIIYLAINLIFIIKYGSRITSHYLWLSLAYLMIILITLLFIKHIPQKTFNKKKFYSIVILFVIFSIGCFAALPQESIRLDRWEMIQLFWDNFFSGINPYTPGRSINIPSGFPMYFYLALPFYLVGEIGYYSLLGFGIFVILLRKFIEEESDRIKILFALVFSPVYVYEVICRSTLFLNSTMALAFILAYADVYEKKHKTILISAGILGFILSTRSVILLIMMPFLVFIDVHKNDYKRILIWGLGITIAFAVTFLPLIFFQEFFTSHNPFFVQNNFISKWIPGVIIMIMSFVFLKNKKLNTFIFGCMISLVLITGIFYVNQINNYGFNSAFFKDNADVTYIILALPFVLFCLGKKHLPIVHTRD